MFLSTRAFPTFVIADNERLVPRYWATVWAIQQELRGLAANTRKASLHHLDAFYEFSDQRFGLDSLDVAIGARDAEAFQTALEAFYGLLSAKGYGSTEVARWNAVRAFCHGTARRLAPYLDEWRALDALIGSMGNLKPPNQGRPRFIRAIPTPTLEDLLVVAEPGSARNPFFDRQVQWRNWLVLNLLLLAGLRRGEALLLQVDSLKSDVERRTSRLVYWLDVTTIGDEDEDPRATRPSIKTAQSHRQVPISNGLAALYNHYVNEVRVPGEEHQFLLTSKNGDPLSAESITKALSKVTLHLSEQAITAFIERSGGKHNVSAHDLRHTCASARYGAFMRQNADQALAFQRMRAFFGWSKTSEMPEHYARAAIQDDLLATWDELFESRVDLLRSLK